MDGSRLKRLKVRLQIGDWGEMDQKQFNDLVTNLSYLDQDTVRSVVKNIPDLSEKVLNYFTQLHESTRINMSDYFDAMKDNAHLLADIMKDESTDCKIKNRIADELLEHSKWLRKEATLTRIFKMAVTAIGLGLAFVFVQGMGNSTRYKPEDAREPRNKVKHDYSTYDYSNDDKEKYDYSKDATKEDNKDLYIPNEEPNNFDPNSNNHEFGWEENKENDDIFKNNIRSHRLSFKEEKASKESHISKKNKIDANWWSKKSEDSPRARKAGFSIEL